MKRIISIVFAFALMLSLPITAFALDFDEYRAKLVYSYSQAPKGTEYIDILIKMDKSDENYTEFTSPPRWRSTIDDLRIKFEYEDMPIDKDSEIARLDDDGYISLSLHYKYTSSLEIIKDTYFDSLTISRTEGSSSLENLHDTYGDFKAAYVDENGNVLGITSTFKTRYSNHDPYGFSANGDDLTFIIFGSSVSLGRFVVFIFLGIPAFLLLLFSPLIILITLRKRRERKELIEQSESRITKE